MNVTINGESRNVETGTTLQALLDQMEVQCDALVVQRNDDIVSRDAFPATQLADGDLLELVRFVGGG